MDKYSFLNAANTQFFADLYDQYVENPDSVEASWRAFFQGFDFACENYGEDFFEEEVVLAQSQSREVPTPVVASAQVSLPISDKVEKELRVLNLIKAYQQRAHLFAKISPITQRPSLMQRRSFNSNLLHFH